MGGIVCKENSLQFVFANDGPNRKDEVDVAAFQLCMNEDLTTTVWYERIHTLVGNDDLPLDVVIQMFRKHFNILLSKKTVKSFLGNPNATTIAATDIYRMYAEATYNPVLGNYLYQFTKKNPPKSAAKSDNGTLRDYKTLSLSRGNSHGSVHLSSVRDFSVKSLGRMLSTSSKADPIALAESPSAFVEFALGPRNDAFSPIYRKFYNLHLPLTQYFVNTKKLSYTIEDNITCDFVALLHEAIIGGARALDLQISGSPDGVPRVFADLHRKNYPKEHLPTLKQALDAIHDAYDTLSLRFQQKHPITLEGTRFEPPLILLLTIDSSCSEKTQQNASLHFKTILGKRIGIPSPNTDNSVWSLSQLSGKIVLCGLDKDFEEGIQLSVLPGFQQMMHFETLHIAELRKALDNAGSKEAMEKEFCRKVLVLSVPEALAYLGELAPLASLLLIYVKSSKFIEPRLRTSSMSENLRSHRETKTLRVDDRFQVEYMGDANSAIKLVSEQNKINMGYKRDQMEPLRGWINGAHMIALNDSDETESTLLNRGLFDTCDVYTGFIPKVPDAAFRSYNDYRDLYARWNCDEIHQLYVSILSASGIKRDSLSMLPSVRVYYNNGFGLRQIGITSLCEDNGYVCLWEDTFEFKIDPSESLSSSMLLFTMIDRSAVTPIILAWGCVPVWGLRNGLRSVRLQNNFGENLPESNLLIKLTWRQDMPSDFRN